MPALSLPFGSTSWLESVRQTPPVRRIKSRSRRTNRHAPWLFRRNRLSYVESRYELIGILALEYLEALGHISFYKEQPFCAPGELWDQAHTGIGDEKSREYTPDFFAESSCGRKFVIEVKSARFVNRTLEQSFEVWKYIFAEHGLTFLLWTDKSPLVHHLRTNLIRMRRAAVEFFEQDELDRLVALLDEKGPLPVWALYEREFDLDLVACAAWQGKVHFPVQQLLSGQTQICLERCGDLAHYLLGTEPDIQRWWNTLENAA